VCDKKSPKGEISDGVCALLAFSATTAEQEGKAQFFILYRVVGSLCDNMSLIFGQVK
jgi:cyclophilin family peptidyl-prolyl cis-trans isomerase